MGNYSLHLAKNVLKIIIDRGNLKIGLPQKEQTHGFGHKMYFRMLIHLLGYDVPSGRSVQKQKRFQADKLLPTK